MGLRLQETRVVKLVLGYLCKYRSIQRKRVARHRMQRIDTVHTVGVS